MLFNSPSHGQKPSPQWPDFIRDTESQQLFSYNKMLWASVGRRHRTATPVLAVRDTTSACEFLEDIEIRTLSVKKLDRSPFSAHENPALSPEG